MPSCRHVPFHMHCGIRMTGTHCAPLVIYRYVGAHAAIMFEVMIACQYTTLPHSSSRASSISRRTFRQCSDSSMLIHDSRYLTTHCSNCLKPADASIFIDVCRNLPTKATRFQPPWDMLWSVILNCTFPTIVKFSSLS